MMDDQRTFNSPVRSRWNVPIRNCLKAIDNHVELYFLHRDPWHLEKADILREYVRQLKHYILAEEEKARRNGLM